MSNNLIRTAVIGSYPQPNWLVDHSALNSKFVPRVRARDIWRIDAEHLEEAQNNATLLAIRDQERAGVDVITDGEIRRESYSNRFATSLAGVDTSQPFIHTVGDIQIPLPRIVGPLRRTHPVEVDSLRFLKNHTSTPTKVTLPGPFTLSKQASDEHYGDPEAVAMAFADAVNQEALDLQKAGADVIQIDEPWLRQDPDRASQYAVAAINRALKGIETTTAIHLCFGYGFVVSRNKPKAYSFLSKLSDCIVDQISIEAAQPHLDLGVLHDLSKKTILLGAVDLSTNRVESSRTIADRIRRALPFVAPERLIAAPDCGMKYLSRWSAFGKLCSLVAAARTVRLEQG